MIKKLLNTKISKENKKGFTLAELLIVVAIIGVLVAISIPIFTSQLEKSREATDKANLRSAYAEASTWLLTWDGTSEAPEITVNAKQAQANWQSDGDAATVKIADGTSTSGIEVTAKTKGSSWTVKADTANNKVTIT